MFWVRADPLRIGMHTNCHGRSPAIASAMLLSLSRSNARVQRSFTCPHALASGCHTTAAELLRASAAARKGIVCTGHVLVTDQRGAVVTAGVTRTGACQDAALISKRRCLRVTDNWAYKCRQCITILGAPKSAMKKCCRLHAKIQVVLVVAEGSLKVRFSNRTFRGA